LLAYNMRFGGDGRLWFSTLCENAVMSLDLATFKVETHFANEAFCTYCFNGQRGAIGTMDGKVLTFSVDDPTLCLAAEADSASAIGPIELDYQSDSLFYGCRRAIYRTSLAGEPLGNWPCKLPCRALCFSSEAVTLWSVCDGIELINVVTGESTIKEQNRQCPYANIALAPDETVALAGGDINIFTSVGKALISISGDYNQVHFGSYGRLLAREVVKNYFADVTVSTRVHAGLEYDVLSHCNSFAMDSSENVIVASHLGKLYFFARR